MNGSKPRYVCKYGNRPDWDQLEAVWLRGTEQGETLPLQTEVRAYWDEEALHFRFLCEDSFTVATMTERDDPLYEEDVVEIFIDEEGEGRRYMEFEFSPCGVIFDALIENDLKGRIAVDPSWNVDDLAVRVQQMDEAHLVYFIDIPNRIFTHKPAPGREYRINLYRIDQMPDGKRYYGAWSPTGKVNYHIPQRFGTFVFER